MKELILLKCGEIALKGLNRGSFEDMLIRNAKYSLYGLGEWRFYKAQSTIYAAPKSEGLDLDAALDRLSRVFGVSGLCKARVVEKDFAAIREASLGYLREELEDARSFKVEAKRSDKRFPMNSPEICRELGGAILQAYPHLRVDVQNPEVTVVVEVRDFGAYIHRSQLPGAGGIPVGSGGNAALLLSGGIDSPVAGWMLAKRGVKVLAVHFSSPPYTGERSLMKVKALCEKLSPWCGRIRFFNVGFTKIQEAIRNGCPEELFTLVMRRQMMQLAEEIALQNECGALITGESVGQVASQTLAALRCTEAAVRELPVLRPVIGMDKEEIIAVARRIDTFETSILPYEDCCTVFTPRHPKTKPRLAELLTAEAALGLEPLRAEALREARWEVLGR